MKELRVDFRRKSRSCENKKIGYPLYKKEDTHEEVLYKYERHQAL